MDEQELRDDEFWEDEAERIGKLGISPSWEEPPII